MDVVSGLDGLALEKRNEDVDGGIENDDCEDDPVDDCEPLGGYTAQDPAVEREDGELYETQGGIVE